MKPTYHPLLHSYALFLVCWTVVLLTAGALVTSKDAALAVPDWPLSYGTLNPPMVGGIAFEHSHRLIAAGLGMLIIGLAVALWRTAEQRWLRWLGVVALGGVIAQGVLGGLTVLQLLRYWLPVMHACTAQLEFAVLVSIAFFTSRWWTEEHPLLEDKGAPGIHGIVVVNAALVFVQVLMGAGFRHKYMTIKPHLVGAAVVLMSVIWTAMMLKRRFEKSAELSRVRMMMHALVGLQLLLGGGSLWSRVATADGAEATGLTVALTVVHTVVGAVLFATSIVTVLLCYRLVPRKREMILVTTRGEVPVS